ncbi:Low-density lipoprotein receptor-related protein 10 [Oryzias melastigma]|uniref:Low-density lipoprotein receptor-related protein 10 n=1 Tax=Oryzias melastigma TaxID=30732 RepID=A0A834FBN3_ORYME|nr:Low-density lipoprotein receptor-related protein 10 [Oryzias melastigma]
MTVSYKLCALLVFSITAYSHLESPFCVAHCGASPQVLDSDTGEIRSSSYNTWTYRFGSVCDCWVIKGSENEPIVLRFSRFFVKCDKEWVSLKSSADDEPVVLCGKTLPEPLKFPGGNITVVHHFLPHQYPVSKFILSYFRESENCPKTSFQCPRGQCIPLFLRCNGRIDCPDDDSGADEQGCDDDMDYLEVQTVANKDSERQMVTEKTQSLVRTTPGYGYDDFWQSERAQLGQEQPQTKAETLVSTTPVEWPCGGLFQTFYGTFSSPAPRGNRLFCVWSLDPQDSRPLRLDLQQLVLGPVDRLTVYNRGEGKGDVIKNITNTSNYKSVQVESHTGLMSLVYETFPGSEAGGFKATFHVGSYCPPSEYRCGGSMGGCYTKEQRCDGKWDCPETGKDEEACRGCGTNQPVCYPATERCNYQLYCADLSDEKDCTVCQPGTFHCDSDRCVFESWRCDGQVDCKDGTDELNCTVMLPRKVITAATVGSLVCGLLLVIAMGCTCKLYSLRTREYSLFAPISRQEAQLIQQQAPPSYGQLIAQGVIPPVEDFPTENPNEVLMLMVVLVLEPPGSLMHKCIHDEVQAGVEVIRGERSLHEPKLAQEPRARRSTKQRGIVGNSFTSTNHDKDLDSRGECSSIWDGEQEAGGSGGGGGEDGVLHTFSEQKHEPTAAQQRLQQILQVCVEEFQLCQPQQMWESQQLLQK